MSDRATELLNLELDGQLDAGQRAELAALLAADPALAARRDSLRAVARALAAAPALDVPPGFADAVIDKARWRKPRRGLLRSWRGGLALAASLLVAVVVLRVVDTDLAADGVSATIAPATPRVAASRQVDGALLLRFELPARSEQLVIDFGDGAGGAALAASADVPVRVEGRRIVIPAVAAGPLAVRVTGAAGEFTANVVQDGNVKPVTVQQE